MGNIKRSVRKLETQKFFQILGTNTQFCRNYITYVLYIQDSPDHILFYFMHNTESIPLLIITCGN